MQTSIGELDFLPAINHWFLVLNSLGPALVLTVVGGIVWTKRHRPPPLFGPAIILSIAIGYILNFLNSPAHFRVGTERFIVGSQFGFTLEAVAPQRIKAVFVDEDGRFKAAYSPLHGLNVLLPNLDLLGDNEWTPLSALSDSYFLPTFGWVANHVTDPRHVVVIQIEGGTRPTCSIMVSPKEPELFIRAVQTRLLSGR